jgi:hypothetical protein
VPRGARAPTSLHDLACWRDTKVVAQLWGEGAYDGEEDEYDDALARYAALGLLKNKKNIDDDDDTTPEMMLEYSMKRLDALQHRAENETQPIDMQAAVAAAIDAAAALEAKKMKKNPPRN